MYKTLAAVVLSGFITGLAVDWVHGDEWPGFRSDNSHSGASNENIQIPLHLQWTYVPKAAPRPAWPEPCKEVNRTAFDYAPQISSARGLIFFGSSADHKLYAIDLQTGRERWHFFTEGPVRFAPAVSGDRVFVASDDGCLYCLTLKQGDLLWRFHGGPRDERMMGNEQMISRWPARAGVLVQGNTAYFTAGMWQSDGTYIYALDADDGTILWENSTSARKYMGLPHSGQEGIAGVSPQGQLALHKDTLVVPGGRMMPAGFDRNTGRLLFCDNGSDKLHHAGGAWVITAKGMIFANRRPVQGHPHVELKETDPPPGSGLLAWNCRTGKQELAIAGKHRAVIKRDTMYAAGNREIVAIDLNALIERGREYRSTGRVDPELPKEHIRSMMYWRGAGYPWGPWKVVPVSNRPARKWQSALGRTYELILGGKTLVAGGRGQVTALSADDGSELWKTAIDGNARGLAIADGRLIVSSTTGEIHCFGAGKVPTAVRVTAPTTEPDIDNMIRDEAARILRQADLTSGYALLVGAGDGRLAHELTEQSDLTVYCIEPDVEKVTAARKLLDDAGIYGTRVTVHFGGPTRMPYADYFANLIVLNDELAGGPGGWPIPEIYRTLRPCGGVLYATSGSRTSGALKEWLIDGGISANEITEVDGGVRVVRGKLPGASQWTHKYCSAARPAASTDKYVRPPLKMLWFGKPGPAKTISRHWRTPPPLFSNGRMFVSGEHHLMAVDAYNGRIIWTREIPNVGRYPARYRGGQIVADTECLYAVRGVDCYKLDAATGETLETYSVPKGLCDMPVRQNPILKALDAGGRKARPTPNEIGWEFLAVTDDLVVGSVGQPNFAWTGWPEAHPECKHVFALEKTSGKLMWTYTADESVSPEAICIINDRIYLIDCTGRAAIQRSERRGKGLERTSSLKALDLTTGTTIWETDKGLGGRTLWSNGEILLATNPTSSAYSSSTGEMLWSRRIRGHQYPVIIGDTFYLYPGAYDMHTGRAKMRTHPMTDRPVPWQFTSKGGCGSFSGCPGALFCRAGAAGIYDLAADSGMGWLGQIRPSCWVNMIPAGGMLLCPEGSSSCSCPYNYQTSLAMIPDNRHEKWYVFPENGAPSGSRIRKLHVNFGAVGDRRDSRGALWAAFPRPFKPGALTVPIFAMNLPAYYRYNADETPIKNTDEPWLYTCGSEGLRRTELGLFMKQPVPAPPSENPPLIDGRLDDKCWDGKSPLVLTSDNQATNGKAVAFMRTDDTGLYIGFMRRAAVKNGKPVPWTGNTHGTDARPWDDDSFGVRLWDAKRRTGIYMHLSNTGASFEGRTDSTMRGLIGSDASWNGTWRKKAVAEPGMWSAEIAVPWETLENAGMRRNALSVYLESINHTGVGPERRQYKYRTLRRLYLFKRLTPMVYSELPRHPRRYYDLALHFAELDDVKKGERVFDVRLQGKTVIEGLDVIEQAGGRRTALVKMVNGIAARDKLTLELVPRTEKPPIISAVEIHYDESKAMSMTAESIKQGIVAHWSFDGKDPGTAVDLSGNGHAAEIISAKRVPGRIGSALRFDGEDDHVNCGNADSFDLTEELTVSAWINVHDFHHNLYHDVVLSKGADTYSVFLHRKSDGAIKAYLGIEGEQRSIGLHETQFDEWHHIAVTVRNGRQATYYDGAPAGGTSAPGPLGSNDRKLLIGYSENFPVAGHFNGMIDEVRIHNRALSEEEIHWLYRAAQ